MYKGIAKISINRPEKHNAFRPQTVKEMIGTMHICREDERIIHLLKSSFNAELGGQAGIQELADNATLLYYMSEEAKEGFTSFLEKRPPDFSKFPKFP